MKTQAIRILVVLLTVSYSKCDDIKYEDASKLCETRCDCKNLENNNTLQFNCTGRNMRYVLNNWPDMNKKLIGIFSKNDIVRLETLPTSFAELELSFDHCNIKELASGIFEACVNITYLDLSYNFITAEQLHSDVFKGPFNISYFKPIKLRHLNLGFNQIHTLNKNIFEHLPDLQTLNLEGNGFNVIDLQTSLAIGVLTNLKYLNLASNFLTEIPNSVLKNLKLLRELDISHNDLDFIPNSLGFLGGSLKVLKVDANPILELDDEAFQGNKNLTFISASKLSKLLRIKTNTFAHLSKLSKVDLSFCTSLAEIDEEAFGNITSVRELNLSNGNLSHLPVNMMKWEFLKSLDITENPFICTCEMNNVTVRIPEEVKSVEDGPTCWDDRKPMLVPLYDISIDLCSSRWLRYRGNEREIFYKSFMIMRVTLVTFSIVLLVTLFVATWLIITKWKKYRMSKLYPFANQVVYNPVSTELRL